MLCPTARCSSASRGRPRTPLRAAPSSILHPHLNGLHHDQASRLFTAADGTDFGNVLLSGRSNASDLDVGTPRCGVRLAQRADPTSLLESITDALLKKRTCRAGVKGYNVKVVLARHLWQETVMSRKSMARRLHMGGRTMSPTCLWNNDSTEFVCRRLKPA